MSDVLARICAIKRDAIARRKACAPLAEVESAIRDAPPVRDFAAAMAAKNKGGAYALIAEIKRASPSAGRIREDFNPAQLAGAYETGGAACLSVLTEEDHFSGQDSHLKDARSAVSLPILRKDFMLEPYQVAEARAIGADCILLIMAALNDSLAIELESCALSHGMAVLIEVHDELELERAVKLKSPLIGVNNRNLKTLQTDLAVTERLAALLPAGRVVISESGLKTQADVTRMARCGVRRFLIGESLMRQPDVETATRTLVEAEYVHA